MSQQQSPKQYPFTDDRFHRNNKERAQAIAAAQARGHVVCECSPGKHQPSCPNIERGTGTTLSQRSFGGPDYEDSDEVMARRGQEGEFSRSSE